MTAMILAVFIAIAPVTAAPARKTSFTAEVSFIPGSVSPGKGWVTKQGIQQVRGATSEGNVSGDISGTMWLMSYETVNLSSGKGINHGRFVITLDGGTFKGIFWSRVTLPVFSGKFVGHGTGMYNGQKIMGSHEGEVILDTIPVAALVLEGVILSPKE